MNRRNHTTSIILLLSLFAAGACGDDDSGGSPDGRPGPADGGLPDGGLPDAEPPDAAPLDPTEGRWRPGFILPGTSGFGGRVTAIVPDPEDSSHIYVAGIFVDVAGTEAFNVASWNGTTWAPLGDGLPGQVNALAFGPDGALYAGGEFGGENIPNRLARFDGTSWSMVPGDVVGSIESLALQGERLLVGGFFEDAGGSGTHGLAAWTQAGGWTAVADVDGKVDTITLIDGDTFCIGGIFGTVAGVVANHVACFDGEAWAQLGDTLNSEVKVLVRGPDDNIYAGGTFFWPVGDEVQASIARLESGVWTAFEGGVGGGFINDVRAIAFASDGDLVIGGTFGIVDQREPLPASNLARWDFDTSTWSATGGGVVNQVGVFLPAVLGVNAILPRDDGHIFVGGIFSRAGEVAASNIARLTEGTDSFAPLVPNGVRTDGVGGVINSLVIDGQGHPLIGGWFTFAGRVPVNNVARYGASGWEALGAGLDGIVRILFIRNDGTLLAGGEIFASRETPLSGVAMLSGTNWQSMGDGFDGQVLDFVETEDGTLYACGEFTFSGAVQVNNVARWTGTAWEAVGAGLDSRCTSLAIDSAGHLVAVGLFDNSGDTPLNGIGTFDGEAWHGYGAGMNDGGYGEEVVRDGEGLIVAGNFTNIDGTDTLGLVRFDGESWTDLSVGFEGSFVMFINLVRFQDGMFAVGIFESFQETSVRNLAWFDGTTWHPLGSGLNDLAEVVALSGRTLWVGGPYLEAGGIISSAIAAWDF